ncbi:MAG: hypothetical protein D6746_04840, partial [Bacteroidetes bacterium]
MNTPSFDSPSAHDNHDRTATSHDGVVTERLSDLVRAQLSLLGEDPEREGLLKTPERVAKALQFLTQGYTQDPRAILTSALFEE